MNLIMFLDESVSAANAISLIIAVGIFFIPVFILTMYVGIKKIIQVIKQINKNKPQTTETVASSEEVKTEEDLEAERKAQEAKAAQEAIAAQEAEEALREKAKQEELRQQHLEEVRRQEQAHIQKNNPIINDTDIDFLTIFGGLDNILQTTVEDGKVTILISDMRGIDYSELRNNQISVMRSNNMIKSDNPLLVKFFEDNPL